MKKEETIEDRIAVAKREHDRIAARVELAEEELAKVNKILLTKYGIKDSSAIDAELEKLAGEIEALDAKAEEYLVEAEKILEGIMAEVDNG